jgi:hypothetical protein
MGKMRNEYKIFVGNLETLGDLGVDRRIILK